VDGDAEHDDRLAQREDDDQVEPLGEMRRDQPPTGHPEQRRTTPVEQDREDPHQALRVAVERGRHDQQADRDRAADRQAQDRAAEVWIAAARDQEQDDVTGPNHAVGDGERQGPVTERLRHAQRDDQEPGDHTEHRDPYRALLRIDDAGQPGVRGPRPPQHRQHQQPSGEAGPMRVGDHQRGALGEAEHEDQVEEQLQRLHGLALAQLRAESRQVPRPSDAPPHRWVISRLVSSGQGAGHSAGSGSAHGQHAPIPWRWRCERPSRQPQTASGSIGRLPPSGVVTAPVGVPRDQPDRQHQVGRLEPAARGEQPLEQGGRDRVRRVRHDSERPARQPYPLKIGLDDAYRRVGEPLPELRSAAWMQLDGDHLGSGPDEGSGQGTRARAQVEHELARAYVSGSDDPASPLRLESMPPPAPSRGHDAPSRMNPWPAR